MRYTLGRPRRFVAGLAAVLLTGSITTAALLGPPAAAAAAGANLTCAGGTIYSLDQNDHILYSVDTATGAQTAVTTFGASGVSVPTGTTLNGIAITRNGTAAYAVVQSPGRGGAPTIYRYDPVTGQTASFPGPSMAQTAAAPSIVMGGIDPANGIYYFATVTAATKTIEFYGFDTTTDAAIPGRIGTLSGYPGTNGDLVFDSLGHLYLVATAGNGSATANPLVAVDGITPATGSDTAFTASTIAYLGPNNFTFNGIAFDSSGELYVEARSTSPTQDLLYELNPNSGAVVSTHTLAHGGTTSTDSVDLASCTYNNSLTLQKNIVNRAAAADQFGLSVTGGGLTVGNTATTTGTDTGVQSRPSEFVGPLIGVSGATYTLTETGAGGADLADYISSYVCVDASANGAVIASGTGTSFNLTFPQATTPAGRNVVCTFSNGTLETTKAISMVNGHPADAGTELVSGDVVTYTVTVHNPMPAGSPSASTTLTETVPLGTDYTGSGEGWTCAATGPGSSCTHSVTAAPGASVAVPFTVTVTSIGGDRPTVTNTVTTSVGTCSACTVTTPTGAALATVKALATVNGAPAGSAPAVKAGDVLDYTLTTTNTGGSPGTTTLTEAVPVHTTYTGTGEGWACSGSTCTQDVTVAAAAMVTTHFTVTVGALPTGAATVTNVVTSSSGSCSPCTITTPTAGMLDTVKSVATINGVAPAAGQTVKAGDVIGYAMAVTNSGGSAATTTLTETVPAHTTYTGTDEGWACQSGTCTQSLEVDASATKTVSFTVTVSSPLGGDVATITNTVTTSSGTCSTCTVTVTVAGETPAAPTVPASPVAPASTPPLASTGLDVRIGLTFALGLLLLGAGLLLLARRRRV